jgi:hypothetical protein
VLASPAVARLAAHGNRAAALTWAAIAEAGLGGVLLVWLISPSAAETAGYGSALSISVLVASMLFTAVGMGIVLSVHRLARPIKLIMTLLIAVTAGGVIPLALAELFAADSGGYGLLLILAVTGMEVLAVQIPRATRPIPS